MQGYQLTKNKWGLTMEINVNATYPVQYNKPNIEYQQITVKVNGSEQSQTVYTYDKNGNLIETVVRRHDIGEI